MGRNRKQKDRHAGARESRRSVRKQSRDLPRWKLVLLGTFVPITFFLMLEAVLAAVGVRPILYEKDPYVGFSSYLRLYTEVSAPDGTRLLRTSQNKLSFFNPVQFPKVKEEGVVRVFCVGGSTTYGRPYDNSTSFCGWLRQLLPALDSSRRWEVVNAGGISYASYRVALLMEELVQYDPDLFIVYSGHNEFLEERTYEKLVAMPRSMRGIASLAYRTRIYAMADRALDALRATRRDRRDDPLASEVKSRLDASVGPDAYTRDEESRSQILRHYRFNLARMIDITASAGVPSIVVVPASNLRSSTPFKSEHREGITDLDKQRWEEMLDDAHEARVEGRLEASIRHLEQAANIDDRYAELHHIRGLVLQQSGRFAEAKVAFERARDEDVVPLRALSPMLTIVRDIAADRQVQIVDYARIVEDRSPNGLPGDNLFLDHVHPTIEGNRLLALAIIDEMRRNRMVTFTSASSGQTIARVTDEVMAGIDQQDHGIALMNLSKVLGWAGKLDESYALAGKATTLAPESPEVLYQAGLTAQLSGHVDEAIGYYQRVTALAPTAPVPHGNLGAALEQAGQTESAIRSYKTAISLLGDNAGEYRTGLEDTVRQLETKRDGETPPDSAE